MGTRDLVWGGHASRGLVSAVLAVLVAVLIWLCGDIDRLRLIGYDFREMSSEAAVNDPPGALGPLGYTEDDPRDLHIFRAIAEPIVAGIGSDAEKLRRLGDYILSLRREGAPDVGAPRLSVAWEALQRGEHGSCGEMSRILAAFWRSLGGHARAVQWATASGTIGHDAVEMYSPPIGRWIYYDMNLNGYGEDSDHRPLSIASLRAGLLTGEAVHLVANAQLHDWDAREFRDALRRYPVESYALNNRSLYFEAGRRFGPLNGGAWLFDRLPGPFDRAIDNMTGNRDRRLVVTGKIQIAGLFTFEGARRFLGFMVAMIALCTTTLVHARHRTTS